MVVAPALTVWLLLARRHLMEGLLFGILAAAAIGLTLGLLEPSELLYIDSESFSAKGIVLEGLESTETYIVDGIIRARPGLPVNPLPPEVVEETD